MPNRQDKNDPPGVLVDGIAPIDFNQPGGALLPGDEERVRRIANFYISSYANVENAYRQGELAQRAYESYCHDFRRILVEYPALTPKMRAIMEHFDAEYFQILSPLYE